MAQTEVIETETCVLPSSPYYFGRQIAHRFPEFLKRHPFDRCFLVTSEHLAKLIGVELVHSLSRSGVDCQTIAIADTERDKNWDTLRGLCEALTARGVTKDTIVIAMGGGVAGNLAGMAAGLVYRGIRFVHVPTTVTAITDSTLSNKQAINGPGGKNQFGLYHAPLFVWADAAYPLTEPPRQQRSGVVEGIKNVLISRDGPEPAEAMLQLWRERRLPELMWMLIESKQRILRRDPSERGYAVVLEYGHTFGHAIEWLARGRLLHGEAVSIGMCLAAQLSRRLGWLDERVVQDHDRLLESLGAPTRLPPEIPPADLYETMLSDNKRTGKGLRFLLLKGYRQFAGADGDYQVPVDRATVLKLLEDSRREA